MSNILILAQAQGREAQDTITSEPAGSQEQSTTKAPADANQPGWGRPKSRGMDTMSIILIVVMIFFVFMMFRGPRRKQQEHRKMVQSLQKNDRVRTIGGIYGTVVDVREDEIVLKVDEANNTKIRVASSAIGSKLSGQKS